MAPLISLAEYKAAQGISGSQDDTKILAALTYASAVILNYTMRDFGSPTVTEQRAFQYDTGTYIDIDDCTAITDVSLSIPGYTDLVLTADQWVAQPPRRDDSPVFYYLVIPAGIYGPSPLMGFSRNIDRLAAEGRWGWLPPMVKVTATWGWPVVPDDVKQAVVWTLEDWLNRQEGEGLTSESIETYSRSWGSRSGQMHPALAIPNRAADVLANYCKILV